MIGLNGARGRQEPILAIDLPSISAAMGRDHRAADPALARTHPATGEGLELVWALRPKLRCAPDCPDRYLLAPAGDDFIFGRDHDRASGAIKAVEKWPECAFAVALGCADVAEPPRGIERSEPPGAHAGRAGSGSRHV